MEEIMRFYNLLTDIAPGAGPPLNTTSDTSHVIDTAGVFLIIGAILLSCQARKRVVCGKILKN